MDSSFSSNSSSMYRQSDNYGQTKDSYATNSNAYENSNNAYEKRGESEQSTFFLCRFWFVLKVKMQELFSSDIGLQKEERIITSDTDLFKVDLLFRIQSRSFFNMITVPIVVVAIFLILIKTNTELTLIFMILQVALIVWLLFCPAHQTYTAGAYALHKNSQELYKNWRKQFSIYQTMTILGYFLGTIMISGLAFFPEVYNLFIGLVEGVIHLVPLFISYQINQVDVISMQKIVMFVTLTNVVTIFIYFLFISQVAQKAKKQRIAYKKTNIDDRTLSHFMKRRRTLDGV